MWIAASRTSEFVWLLLLLVNAVAEHFWKLHSQPVDAWEAEANYSA